MISSTWWTRSLAGVLPEQFAGGVYHAIYGTLIQAGVAAVLAVPLGVLAARLSGGVRPRTARAGPRRSWSTSSPACRRSWRRCSSTRCGSPRWASSRARFAVSLALVLLMIPVIVRSTEEMLQARSRWTARSVATRWACRSGRPSRGSSPDRAVGHRHRHPAGAGPGHGRDGAAADPGRLRAGRSTSTCSAAIMASLPGMIYDRDSTDAGATRSGRTAAVGRRAHPHPAVALLNVGAAVRRQVPCPQASLTSLGV